MKDMSKKKDQKLFLCRDSRSSKFHATEIIERLTSRPILKDEEGFHDINADNDQMIEIVQKYLKKNFMGLNWE